MPPKKRPHPSSASPSSSASVASTSASASAAASASASTSTPASASASASTSKRPKSMKRLAECPICFEIPRDGVMLQCQNGHNICSTCKNKMGDDKKCPQGECDYSNPPVVNRTVAEIVDSYIDDFPCKYAKIGDDGEPGCKFVGTKELLEQHEEVCQHRLVPCIRCECKRSISANKVIEHMRTVHNAVGKGAFNDVITKLCLWKNEPSDFYWHDRAQTTSFGWVFPCAQIRNGQVYVWLVMLAPKSEADKFKCQITLSEDDRSMRFPAPVYPIDWKREKIMQDEKCVCLSFWSIRQMLTENLHEDSKKCGFSSTFLVTYKVVKNTI